jgi:glycosyltransferase involved in cell wall biosynthesis
VTANPTTPDRVAVVWPRPRADRWRLGRTDPDHYPDQSDALLELEGEGFRVDIENSLGWPWNPLARMHEFYSGLDPLRAARLAVRARRYTAAVCVGDATAYALVWVRRALGLRLPIVLIDPALSFDYPRRKRLQDQVLPRVEKVVVFGRVQLDYLRQEYGGRVDAVFLPHRADTAFYRPGPAPAAAPPYVFSIGNDYSRDFDTLARAARLLADRPGGPPRWVVHTTRPVPAAPGVEVSRAGRSYPELRDLYRGAAVVVIPLRDMIHPGGINSILEAMAAGRPVVVSGSRGVADYVRAGETAVVVPPDDPAALAAAVRDLLDSPAECDRLGRNARRFVVETCQNRVYARGLAAVLRDAIRSGGRRAGRRPGASARPAG